MDEQPHILIVEARFYEDIADELVRGAVAALEQAGADHERIAVPGAFEIPAAARDRFARRALVLSATTAIASLRFASGTWG